MWHHSDPHGLHSHFNVDWHDDPMEYVGKLFHNKYWCYRVGENAPEEDGPVYIAFAREIMADSKYDGRNVEGYWIIYFYHGFAHLWAWDAKTFAGHSDDNHDHEDHKH